MRAHVQRSHMICIGIANEYRAMCRRIGLGQYALHTLRLSRRRADDHVEQVRATRGIQHILKWLLRHPREHIARNLRIMTGLHELPRTEPPTRRRTERFANIGKALHLRIQKNGIRLLMQQLTVKTLDMVGAALAEARHHDSHKRIP